MTIDDERFSAYLDGELSPEEIAELDAAMAADPDLAAAFASLRSVRDLIRGEAMLAMPAASLDRIIADVEADAPAAEPSVAAPARVVSLDSRRRRVPTFAAVAASFLIIVSVVGGLGGTTTFPAVGDLLARHDAAAADASHDMDDMDDDMPAMPASMQMMHAEDDGDLVHALYATPTGSVVSVFRQDGDLDVDGLDGDMDDMAGDVGEIDGHAMWAADIDDLHITVVDGDGYVWTIISDVGEPMDDMMDDMMSDLPTRSAGLVERMRGVADAIVEPFGFGF